MIFKLWVNLVSIEEYTIKGTNLAACLNKLKHVHGIKLEASIGIFLEEASTASEPVLTQLLDISLGHSLSDEQVVHLIPLQDIQGSVLWENLVLDAMGITLSQSTFNTIYKILGYVVLVVGAVLDIFLPGAGVLLQLGFQANSYYIGHDMVRQDPAAVQQDAQQYQSNLFNGAMLTKEQGGVCPLIFGQPYSSGVLISSAILTSDVVV
jgi:predicted phage tail protein